MRSRSLKAPVDVFFRILALLSCLASLQGGIAPAIAAHPPQNASAPQGAGVYVENFQDYQNKDRLENLEWDPWMPGLHLTRRDAISQFYPVSAADHHGLMFVAWVDGRNVKADIYIQKLDRDGNRLWPNDIRVNSHSAVTSQSNPAIAVDANDQVFVTWGDYRDGVGHDIYAQKLTANGTRLWANDVRVNRGSGTSGNSPYTTAIAVDGNGQVCIVWSDNRAGNNDNDIYAQKLDPNGGYLWANDVRVNGGSGVTDEYKPVIAMDGNGQAFIAWPDNRNGNTDIYAQKLDAIGNRLWVNDVRVNSDSLVKSQDDPAIAVDSYGQAFIAWMDGRNDNWDIYVQKLDVNGQRLWTNDIRVNSITSQMYLPAIVIAETGQVYIVWENDSGGDAGIYARKLDSNGNFLWANDVVVVSNKNMLAYGGAAVTIFANDQVFITWGSDTDKDIYAQKLDGTGNHLWGNAVRVNYNGGATSQVFPGVAVDENGQAFVTWLDNRKIGQKIYVQKLSTADNNRQWNTDVRVSDALVSGPGMLDARGNLAITTDQNGHIFIIWVDDQIHAQKLDANGNLLWNNDIRVNIGNRGTQVNPAVAAAGNGQILVTWQGYEFSSGWHIYAQKLDTNGNRLWNNDVYVNDENASTRDPFYPTIAVNETGDALIAWVENNRLDGGQHIYAQKLDVNGNRLWVEDVQVNSDNTPVSSRGHSAIASDLYGQALIVWGDYRDGYTRIYAQKLGASGNRLWANDIRVSSGSEASLDPGIAVDDNGLAYITWKGRFSNIYAQKLGLDGSRLWANDVQASSSSTALAPTIGVSQDGQAFIVWEDYRNGNSDIYTQLIHPSGDKAWANDLQVVQPDLFYYPNGTAQSLNVSTLNETVRKATLTADTQTNNGTLQFYLSNTGGAQWDAVTPGVSHGFTTPGSDLRWKVEMSADPNQLQRSPNVRSLRIEYSTQVSYADDYEPDDICTSARPIALNGAGQAHSFHQSGDFDWTWFDVTAGNTYIIQTSQSQANADTTLELYSTCLQPPLASNDNALGNDASLTWQSTTYAGRVYVKVSNHNPGVYGTQTGYNLSAREISSPPVVVIVAGHDDRHSLQSNIDYSADKAYNTFLSRGVDKKRIKYFGLNPNRDVDGNGLNDDIAGAPVPTAIRDAIQDWARAQGVTLGVPFFLYMVDHGNDDQFLAAGSDGKISAAELNLWLSNLEATTGADNINVIIEACKSGSFIDITDQGPAKISGHNRVVITSTSSRLNAYGAPASNMIYFSGAFWTAFGQNKNLFTAYQSAKEAVEKTGLMQVPWLDDNGDALADSRDGVVARGRGGLAVALSGLAPVVDWVTAGKIFNGQAVLQAQVRDDFNLERVWVEIYPPNFVEPVPSTDGTPPELNRPILTLTNSGGNLFAASYAGFAQPGLYRLVFYARDTDGNLALPAVQLINNGTPTFLPILRR